MNSRNNQDYSGLSITDILGTSLDIFEKYVLVELQMSKENPYIFFLLYLNISFGFFSIRLYYAESS